VSVSTLPAKSSVGEGAGAVRLWLLCIALLVVAMVVVGGATRLTDSGLSITEWQPLLGAIPPLSEGDWQAAFAKYREIPQAMIVNKGMSLAEFKFIFWWEWAHRFLGRFIGIAFALPLAWFWWQGRLSGGLAWRLLGLLVLGGLQGLIGWLMVKSGLVERIDVSPYRLALHLTMAAAILSLVLWTALDLAPQRGTVRLDTLTTGQRLVSGFLVAAVMLQITLGAFVAGLKAGRAYNTWPLMDGGLMPDAIGALSPWYVNPFENMATAQFDHRMMAYLVLALAVWHAVALWRAAADERVVRSAGVVAVLVVGQVALGVWTLLAIVPLSLGLAHQALAMAVLAAAVWHRHRVVRPVG
jgi:cytochrome c oxidase assembly protein subunit 15